MKVRFAVFKESQDLAGKSASNVTEYQPDQPGRGGWDLSLVDILGHVFLRVSVPDPEFARGRGTWWDGHEKKPIYGLGRVKYVPMEQVKNLELAEDAARDMAAAAAAKKKTG